MDHYIWIVAAMALLAVVDVKRIQRAHDIRGLAVISGPTENRRARLSLQVRIVTYVLCIAALVWIGWTLGYVAL
ncbi:hypothetical protein [Roseobacter weihaiensis]|uniref:hypothetical protein n=1 Tax=Roseobacter weihaiensis TaxID=2763262 RepID=UPI001D09A8C3|nr:hypothetical protein [Roseobacter sp. H9]